MKNRILSSLLLLLILGVPEGLLALRRAGAGGTQLTSEMQGGAESKMLDYYDGGLGGVSDPSNKFLPADKLLNKIEGVKKDNTYRRCIYFLCIHYEQYSPSQISTIISKLIDKGEGSDLTGSSDFKGNRIYTSPGYSSKPSKRTYREGLIDLALRLSRAGQSNTQVVNIIRAILRTQVSKIIKAATGKFTSSKHKQQILYGIAKFVIMRIPTNVRQSLFSDVHEFLTGINGFFTKEKDRRLLKYVVKKVRNLGNQFNTIKLPSVKPVSPALQFDSFDSILSGDASTSSGGGSAGTGGTQPKKKHFWSRSSN
jgi:hypothetical protein